MKQEDRARTMAPDDLGQWDVVRLAGKQGPSAPAGTEALALVVSTRWVREKAGVVWTVAIDPLDSPAARARTAYDVKLFSPRAAGLKGPAIVRAGAISTLRPDRIAERLGTITDFDSENVELKIFECLGWTTAKRS